MSERRTPYHPPLDLEPDDTLARAKRDLRQGWETPNGAICQCCGQKVKLYRRALYAAPVLALIRLYRLTATSHHTSSPRVFFHMTEIGTPKSGGGDFSKLQYWGLIAPRPENDNPKTRTSGYWKITPEGIQFVRGQLAAPRAKYIYNDKVIRDDPEFVMINEIKGVRFDWREVAGVMV